MASQGGEEALGAELVTCCDGGPASGQPAHRILAPDGPFRETRDASGYRILPGLGSSAVPPEQTRERGEEGGDGGVPKEGAAEEGPAPRAPSPVADPPEGRDDDIRALPFSVRLRTVVEDQSFKTIYWSRDGESIIIQANFFKSEVLGHKDNQRIFGTDSLRKFVRLLNLHGFRKLHFKSACLSSARNRVIVYRNHNFQRDQPQLMNNIHRKGRERPPTAQNRKRRRMEPTRCSPRLHPVAETDWDCLSGLRVSPGLLAENKARSSEDGACDTQAGTSDLLCASSEEAGPHGQGPPGCLQEALGGVGGEVKQVVEEV
ncbi:heat shock transcription factor, X-linked member 3-like [Sorex fumeus]|uniref:heat shock transcription factor, X-linked member 3-like n=1 Tax=Sorex fumeus TaxID=62283 RepID=UPI0024AD0062|nr:heat shock transcription factor, X-linked member 3-like [Sorex fumeus]